ncbi:MAG: saccharopine dehydrogenase NADP-binding domain-containing protein [Tardiphaga sp.]
MKTMMIYGATGYTGRMAAEHAKTARLDLVIAGRAEAPLKQLAATLGVKYRVFDVEDAAGIDAALSGISVLLNCAGPYLRTAKPFMKAAIRCGTDYLDIAAELDSYTLADALDQEAKVAGVLLLPGSGGSVAMLGCLAGHAAHRVAEPTQIRIALHVTGPMSRGSAISATENMTDCLRLVGGKLVARSPQELRDFDFGAGAASCFPVTLSDLLTIHRATTIPDIETFVHVSGGAFPDGDMSAWPDGPTAEQRDANRYQAAVEVTGADGTIVREVLDTVNGYTFTPMASAEAARRVLAGERRPGFQTPAGLFGNGFAETIADTRISDGTAGVRRMGNPS